MTTLHDKIAALPPYPAPYTKDRLNVLNPLDCVEAINYNSDLADALAARLALLREWIKNHYCTTDCGKWERGDCTCGRDALLKALEGPK